MVAIAILVAAVIVWAALAMLVVDKVHERREARAKALLDWAAERVGRTYIDAAKGGMANGRFSDSQVTRAHNWIIRKAESLAKREGFNLAGALGGEATLEAYAWLALKERL